MSIKYSKLIILLSLILGISASEDDQTRSKDPEGFFSLKKGGNRLIFSSTNGQQLIKKQEGEKLYTEHFKPPEQHAACGMTTVQTDLRESLSAEISESWPYRLIGKLEITFPHQKGKTIGTGILIGPRHVLTCAHNVFSKGQHASALSFYPGSSPENNPFNSFDIEGYFLENPFFDNRLLPPGHKREEYDIALLVLSDPAKFKGQNIGYAGIHCLLKDEMFKGGLHLQLTGYPVIHKETEGYRMYTMSNKIKDVRERTLYYDIPASHGQSGSPLWMSIEGIPWVYGLHTHGTESGYFGTRITEIFFTHIVNWIAQTWDASPSNSCVSLPPSQDEIDQALPAIDEKGILHPNV